MSAPTASVINTVCAVYFMFLGSSTAYNLRAFNVSYRFTSLHFSSQWLAVYASLFDIIGYVVYVNVLPTGQAY